MNPVLTLSYKAAAAVIGYLIAARDADGLAVTASDPTENLIGAADSLGAAAGDMLDIVRVGVAEVRLGGTVDHGDPLTADANGKAVKAVPVAGSVISIIGFAEQDGEADDIVPYLAAPGVLATPAAA